MVTQKFDSKIPCADILERLYKLRIESHRFNTIEKRSFEQNLRNENFEVSNGNDETNVLIKNQGQNSVNKELLEIVGSGKSTDSVSHSRIFFRDYSCSKVREMRWESHSWRRKPKWENDSTKLPQETCTNSFCEKWHPLECLFYNSECGCKFVEKCCCTSSSRRTTNFKGSKKWWQKCSCFAEQYATIGLRISGYGIAEVFIDFAEKLKCVFSIHKSDRTSFYIRDKNPSLGMICPGDLHQRNPNAPNFLDPSQEATEKTISMCPWSSVEVDPKISWNLKKK